MHHSSAGDGLSNVDNVGIVTRLPEIYYNFSQSIWYLYIFREVIAGKLESKSIQNVHQN